MTNTLTTNEWHRVTINKPWVKRLVLVRLSDGKNDVAYWNGMYWCTQGGRPYHNDGADITHFYIFERFIPTEYESQPTKERERFF